MDNSINSPGIIPRLESAREKISEEKFPAFLRLLFFVEMWERFSYYGMRSLLVLFLTSHLGFADQKAYAIYSLFAAIGYAGPVLGGFLADRLMGFTNMVKIGGFIIVIGHLFMSVVTFQEDLIYVGLALIAIGTGLFKGNITNLLGACYNKDNSNRDTGFTIFYVSVNLGSFIASILCGYVANIYGWDYGFGLAGIGMTIGLITFIKFQNILGNIGSPPNKTLLTKRIFFGITPLYIVVVLSLFLTFIVSKMLASSEVFAHVLTIIGLVIVVLFAYIIAKSPKEEKRNLLALSILIFCLMCFFALEMQLGSFINLFTDRNVVKEIFGFTIPTSVSQALNPLSIIVLGTMLSTYIQFNKKHAVIRLIMGLLTLVVCFLILYVGCLDANVEGKVGYAYLCIAMCFIGLGEVLIAPLVQAQTTLLAPKRLRGLVMGMVLLSLAFSNLAGIVIAKFMSIPSVDGVVDPIQSLAIYQEGFLNIALFNLGIVVIFLLFATFLHKVITRNN